MQLAAKRDRSGSSAAVDRFLQDSRRRSCSFVNPSSEALTELSVELKQCEMSCRHGCPSLGAQARTVSE